MNIENPLITIIVGMYKGEEYITECIDSIISQDYNNLEIILVDDGSPDNCGKIADEYAKQDKRIKVIHQTNSGVSTSRNNGINISLGDYICIVDQDDILDNKYVSYFLNLIKKSKAEIATTPQPDKFFKRINNTKVNTKYKSITGRDAVISMLYHNFVIAPWNKMIKSSLIKDNDISFNPEFYGGEGFAFSIECFQYAKKVVVGEEKIYHYRVGNAESGASKFKKSTIESSIEAQKYIKKKLIYNDEEVNLAWNFSNWHTHCDCLNLMIGCNANKNNSKLYKYLKIKCKKDALCALKAPVSLQQKLRGILFKVE